jgi:magnesium chelatase family protein
LAIAIGILKERGEFKEPIPRDSVFIGTLSLDGTVEKVEGMQPALMAAKSLGFKKVYLPYDPLIPLGMFGGQECIVIQHINDALQHLSGRGMLPLLQALQQMEITANPFVYLKDFQDIIGDEQAKQALEIAAAGEHNVVMSGPSGWRSASLLKPSHRFYLLSHQRNSLKS